MVVSAMVVVVVAMVMPLMLGSGGGGPVGGLYITDGASECQGQAVHFFALACVRACVYARPGGVCALAVPRQKCTPRIFPRLYGFSEEFGAVCSRFSASFGNGDTSNELLSLGRLELHLIDRESSRR